MRASISVIIPTLNAEKQLEGLLEALKAQTVKPEEILVVDSESDDRTREIARDAQAEVILIRRCDFDHGATRDMALRRARGNIAVFMTQDALPTDERFLENLIAPFEDGQIAAVSGRQIAYPDARLYERLVRAHNYPAEDLVWSLKDIDALGVRAFRLSDVCAAYRRGAYFDVGGFDYPILTNEDMLIAEKLLSKGYKLAYSSKASVYHSHQFTFMQEYRRNYIIGRTLKRYEERFQYVSEMGAGTSLVKAVMKELLHDGQLAECISFAVNCAARLLGNRMGRYKEAKVRQAAKG
ncbi:MAG: glycosyltransferase [Clostridia bacterium]|nr:glycosyltransferase [Clostridia bacterium]